MLHCRFGKPFKLRCCAAFGGLQKYAQVKELQAGVEIAVATPGRLIDLVVSKACTLTRVTVLVVDEVDRCFDPGFEPQARPPVLAQATSFSCLSWICQATTMGSPSD